MSQRRIAALTGQSQSEISEILGGRQVVSYDLLARIAEGLGVPRGQLGLAYDDATATMVGRGPPGRAGRGRPAGRGTGGGALRRRRGGRPAAWAQPFALAWTEQPERVGRGDVSRLMNLTGQLRAIDHEHGGGACRDAVLAQVGWAQRMLRAQVAADAERELHLAVADLHLLAGWTSFDLGLVTPARRHFARALEHARFVEEPSLVAKALYCLGRVHVHHGWAAQAVRSSSSPRSPAQESGSGRTVAMVQANLGLGARDRRGHPAGAGRDRPGPEEYGRHEHDEVPGWIRFFDSAELQALRGTVLANLPTPTPAQRAEAIERFSLSTALRELPLARPRAFELTALAWLLLGRGRGRAGRAHRPPGGGPRRADPVAAGDRPDGSAADRAGPVVDRQRRPRPRRAPAAPDGPWGGGRVVVPPASASRPREPVDPAEPIDPYWSVDLAQRLMSPSVAN